MEFLDTFCLKVTPMIEQKGMTFDHDFGYSLTLFASLQKKEGKGKGEWIAKIVIKSHAFLLDHTYANCQAQNLKLDFLKMGSLWKVPKSTARFINLCKKRGYEIRYFKELVNFYSFRADLKNSTTFFSLIKTAKFDPQFFKTYLLKDYLPLGL